METPKFTEGTLNQIELYRKVKIENIPDFESEEAAVAWLEIAAKEIGIPHEVTEEDIKNNPEAPEGTLVLGETVILPPVTEPEKGKNGQAENEGTGIAPSKPEVTPAEVKDTVEAPKAKYIYKGKEVTELEDRIINGRLYKDVTIQGETARLTTEEFNSLVTKK